MAMGGTPVAVITLIPTGRKSNALFREGFNAFFWVISMTANIAALEIRLRTQRASLLEDIRAFLHATDDPGKLAFANHLEEVGDWAEADVLNETDIALLGHDLAALRDVDAALGRVARGSYGACTSCGLAIEPARLEALPAAQTCRACKNDFEKRRGIVPGARP